MSVKMRVRKRSPCRSITLAMRRASVMSEPRPKIMKRSCGGCSLGNSCTAAIHRRTHDLDARGKTRKHRLPDQEVADVELGDLRQRRDRFGAGVIEPVTGVHFEAEALGQLGALDDAAPLAVGRG